MTNLPHTGRCSDSVVFERRPFLYRQLWVDRHCHWEGVDRGREAGGGVGDLSR